MIVSSSYQLGHPQHDGRRFVTERHVDHTGEVHDIEYGPVGEIDYQAVMEARAQSLPALLAQRQLADIEAVLLAGGNPYPADKGDFDWVTRGEALAWLLGRHINSPAEVIVKVAPLMSFVDDAELLALGLPQGQIDLVRSRISAALAIRAQLEAYNAQVSGG